MPDNAIQLFTATQDQAPTDLVTDLSRLAQRGVRDVLAYSMAIDRLPEEDKEARREALRDHRSKSNLEFLTLFVGPAKTRNVIARMSDGTVITDSDGNPLYEEVVIENPYQGLINQLAN